MSGQEQLEATSLMRNGICRAIRIAIIFVATVANAETPAAGHQVFLVQNSGWMEPFYADPSSKLKPLVDALITAISDSEEQVTVASFNQKTPANPSPNLIYNGKPNSTQLKTALQSLEVAQKGARQGMADTDFKEAIEASIGALQRRPGILWIFTNNKNSPQNDPDTVKRNREFYTLLHHTAAISRTIAFPLAMPVKGKHYTASGLMVYALAYGEEADRKLQQLISTGRIGKVLLEKPLRLKPLDSDPVEFSAISAQKSDGGWSSRVKFSNGSAIIDMDVDEKAPLLEFKALMTNIFNPYRIDHAQLEGKLSGIWTADLAVTPTEVKELSAGESKEVSIKLPLPLANVPSPWSPAMMHNFGRVFTLRNTMELILTNQQLGIPDGFKKRLGEIFPGDPMPDVFVPPSDARTSSVKIPVVVNLHYPVYPIIVISILLILLLAAMFMLMSRATSRRSDLVNIRIDGRTESFRLARSETREVKDGAGNAIARIRRNLLGRPVISSAGNKDDLTRISIEN